MPIVVSDIWIPSKINNMQSLTGNKRCNYFLRDCRSKQCDMQENIFITSEILEIKLNIKCMC